MTVLLFVLSLGLVVLGLVTLSRTPDEDVRLLPKFPWAIIIVLAPLIGTLAFLLIGRRWQPPVERAPRPRPRASAPPPPPRETTPEEDEALIEAEIRYHEQQAEIRRLEARLVREREERERAEAAQREREQDGAGGNTGEPSGKT